MKTTIPSLLLSLMVVCGIANAQTPNETPSSYYGVGFYPYDFQLGNSGTPRSIAEGQGYAWSAHWNPSAAGFTPDPDIPTFKGELMSGLGLLSVLSHGSSGGFAVEIYPFTAQGLAYRDSVYALYEADPQYSGLLYKSTVSGQGYGIGVTWDATGAWFYGENAVCDIEACSGYNGSPSFINNGAKTVFSPLGTCSAWSANIDGLWGSLGGTYGLSYRKTGQAIYKVLQLGGDLAIAGSFSMTLAPAVSRASIQEASLIPESGTELVINFDTRVSVADPASAVSGTGSIGVCNAWQEDDTTLVACVYGDGSGNGEVRVSAYGVASATNPEIYLDGDGNSPAGDDFVIPYRSEDGPDASVHGFRVVNGVASWFASRERETAAYRIETAPDGTGPWTDTGIRDGPQVGMHTVAVGSANAYRLIEEEVRGRTLIHGIAAPATYSKTREPLVFDAQQLQRLLESQSGAMQAEGVATGNTGNAVIFVPGAWYAEANYLAGYWRAQGWTVAIDTLVSPQSVIQSRIVHYAGGGTTSFLLIGDASDAAEFSSPWPAAWEPIRQQYIAAGYVPQPERNVIPTFAIPDEAPPGTNTAASTPYLLTDAPYADVDGDGLPDVAVTRLPVTDPAEILSFTLKMQQYNAGPVGVTPYAVGLLVGDMEFDTPNDGLWAQAAADAVAAELTGHDVSWLKQSVEPSNGRRNLLIPGFWYGKELLVGFASASGRYWPCHFMDVTVTPAFSVSDLWPGHTPAFIAGSCHAASFARTEDPSEGRPVGEELLLAWDRGAICVIGPSQGSFQTANDVIGRYLVQEFVGNPARPMAESFRVAIRRVLTDNAADPVICSTAQSYAFLGDPFSPFRNTDAVTGVEGGTENPHFALGAAYPNPFAQSATIRFSTAKTGNVTLTIYDVQGRKVRTLVDDVLPAGVHEARWDGRDANGVGAASGTYFYRLTAADGSAQTRTFVRLR